MRGDPTPPFYLQTGWSESAPGRLRTSDTGFRKLIPSGTPDDKEGRAETKQRFYRLFSTSKGTGRDVERHGVVVPLWYEWVSLRLGRVV